jgi:hypothetical protein
MLFDTSKGNINQIKGAVKAYGPVWFHGDGNIYPVQTPTKAYEGDHPSDIRKKHSNKKSSSYRVKFDTIESVPNTVDGINDLLLQSYNRELKEASVPTVSKQVSTFKAFEDEPSAEFREAEPKKKK